MGRSNDIYVQCTRCRNKHWESERTKVAKKSWVHQLVCPRCGCRSYYDLTMQAAWCWASGQIEFGDPSCVPEGAIAIAKGPAAFLKGVIEVVARHGYERGVLLVPGVPEAETQQAAGEALSSWLAWCAKSNGKQGRHGVEFPQEKTVGERK